jgi:putative membrane protein
VTDTVSATAFRARRQSAGTDRFALLLLTAWLMAAIVAGIAPHDRQDWLLENALAPPALAVLVALRLGRPPVELSRAALVAAFVFLLLHELGAHYTYSLVPYRGWADALGWHLPESGRNHYDRVIHLAYGLLVSQPISEILAARCGLRGFALRATTVAWMAFGSLLYELIEWAAAMVFGGGLGIAYLGTQGDPWDAQKDMAMALLGTVLWACRPGRGKAKARH